MYTKKQKDEVKVSYPLKQGLKQYFQLPLCLLSFHVKVSYPLKQGLKPCTFSTNTKLSLAS